MNVFVVHCMFVVAFQEYSLMDTCRRGHWLIPPGHFDSHLDRPTSAQTYLPAIETGSGRPCPRPYPKTGPSPRHLKSFFHRVSRAAKLSPHRETTPNIRLRAPAD